MRAPTTPGTTCPRSQTANELSAYGQHPNPRRCDALQHRDRWTRRARPRQRPAGAAPHGLAHHSHRTFPSRCSARMHSCALPFVAHLRPLFVSSRGAHCSSVHAESSPRLRAARTPTLVALARCRVAVRVLLLMAALPLGTVSATLLLGQGVVPPAQSVSPAGLDAWDVEGARRERARWLGEVVDENAKTMDHEDESNADDLTSSYAESMPLIPSPHRLLSTAQRPDPPAPQVGDKSVSTVDELREYLRNYTSISLYIPHLIELDGEPIDICGDRSVTMWSNSSSAGFDGMGRGRVMRVRAQRD